MGFEDFINCIQGLQIASMQNHKVRKFSVSTSANKVFIWITVIKSRVSSSYFYDVVTDETTTEELEVIINKIKEIFK